VGRDPALSKYMIGGNPPDGYPPRGLWVEDVVYDIDVVVEELVDVHAGSASVDDEADVDVIDDDSPCETPLDEFHEVQRQVIEDFDCSNALHREASNDLDVQDNDDVGSDTLDGLEELYEQAMTPLYLRSKSSVVSATIIIMNMCIVFRVSNRFMDELLHY